MGIGVYTVPMAKPPKSQEDSFEVVFEDPPIPELLRVGTVRMFWEEQLEKLRDHPKEWARVMVSPSEASIKGRRGYLYGIYGKEFKFAMRALGDGLFGLWAMYDPKEEENGKG
jgi:hypothetical protein